MRCKAPRKGPRRRPQKLIVDDEMTELAAVIAEHKLDNNADNWFRMPWRNGWNAVELAVRAYEAAHSNEYHARHQDPWLYDLCQSRTADDSYYWLAQDRLASTITPSPLMRAGLRCLQILLAKSDGGGEVYNAILRGPFSTLFAEQVGDSVLEFRCRDSIGTTAKLQGDGNDRLRRAFITAWSRGLYLAAYSLPSATVVGQLSLKVVK